MSIDKQAFFRGSNVIVTGGAGSVGKEIVDQLLPLDLQTLRVIDNNESTLFEMEVAHQEFTNVEFYHCDITDMREMRRTFSGMDYCFHCAALKHVPSCERSPFSAVNVNILGCENVGRASIENGLKKVIFTSSDKAVNPTNVMGTSKLMGERLITSMNFLKSEQNHTIFSSTRFGNVLGSRGSVVPLFLSQIAKGGPLTITDNRMTRFVMTLSEAANLVIDSMVLAKGGEVFITKMPALRIDDLARVMIDRASGALGQDGKNIGIEIIGARPGEKLWEELSTDEESSRLLEAGEFLIVLPAGHTPAQRKQNYVYEQVEVSPCDIIYHSAEEELMDDDSIWKLLEISGTV